MKHSYQRTSVRLAIASAFMGVLAWGGVAAAADWLPSEPGAQAPDFATVTGSSAEWFGDGPMPLMPDDNGFINDGRAPALTFSYYTVSGATLRGRSSTAEHAYQGLGCVSSTTPADTFLNTELPIPDGATIKYLRIYYNDTSATGTVSSYLTRYSPGQSYTDLALVSSTLAFAGGYGTTLSTELTHVVDNLSWAYTLIGFTSAASYSLQICGMRIAYYAP